MSDVSTIKAILAKRRLAELLGPWDASPEPNPVPLYIKDLYADVAIGRAKHEKNKRAAEVARDLAPLDERLKKLLAKTPLAEQRKGLSFGLLSASLRGGQREHAHVGELGASLRRLGFMRVRRWEGPDGFRALWRKRV
jgi:hypothetical protein